MTRALAALTCGLLGCQQTSTLTASAFVGTNDIVLADLLTDGALVGEGTEAVNRYLVVTSTNTNELRVLDLKSPTATSVIREPLRGPNPLEPLSIPVLDRPTDLSIDTRYENGVRRKGSLVYVTRQGGTEVSIVAIEPSELRELRRLTVPTPVTAITNLMINAATSRLFVATFDGAAASVSSLELPSAAPTLRTLSTAQLTARLTTRLRVDDASIVALLALPGLPGRTLNGRPFCAQASSTCLVVTARGLTTTQTTTSIVDLATLESARLEFGAQVRGLLTIDRHVEGAGGDAPPPGAIVYGVLDEAACSGARCGGVAAVDLRAGVGEFGPLVHEGVATQPVRWSTGLVRGVAVVAGGEVPNALGVAEPVGLLGVMTMSNSEIVFFDGASLSLLERDSTAASLSRATSSLPGAWVAGPSITDGDAAGATLAASIGDGALRTQTVTVAWQGELGSFGLTAPRGVSALSDDELARRVRVGDRLALDGPGCAVTATVVAVGSGAVRFTPATSCDVVTVRPRAAATEPFVLTGSIDGFLGRAAAGATFSTGAPFMRVPGVAPSDARLVIPFGTQTDITAPPTGTTWAFDVVGSQLPLVSIIDPSLFTIQAATSCPAQLQLPGSLVFEPVRGRVFVAYPSANVVAEFDARRAVPGGIGPNQGVSCHR